MYVKVNGGNASYYTLTDLRRDNPNVSFPTVITDEVAAEFSVYPCVTVEPPTVNYTQNLSMADPICIAGTWQQTWTVTPATTEEISLRVADMCQANKNQASQLLTETDYMDLPNTANRITNIAEILAYRDTLRAIAVNPPILVESWPVRPETIWN
jgi:hypothetical protein